ncbi:flippase [Francisella philomiragia]|uniref:Polysaccharide biosynthesis family protein n=1 Tax=Francisella philomiragia TaxID=28110 RepID=A0AAW3D9C8_9GAMM|nr:flippase [Francisella philomiragia]KFJ42454.1 polysaccharide biosynthesis family protein [Francisella philomiragia]MBK2254141.1 flippase [Francisella philomiragia]MBK2272453.1 flippase [Francisella philomiragia]MBK2276295.1 flippase [Francisella philomiragia]MBK2280242.1 flippase [Francisella philomiragia]
MALNINLSDGFKKYFANTGWLFIGNISRMLAALVVGIWVARYLGPEKFGVLNYASSFVALFSVLTTLGLDGIVVRELVKDPSKSNTILGSAFGLKFIGFFALLIILSSVLYLTDESIYTKSIIFIVALSTMMQSFNVLDFYFQSQVKSKFVAFANLISLIISSITKIILILCGAKLIYFAAVVVLDSFTLSIGFIYFYQSKRFGNIKKWRFKFAVAKSLLRDSWPLILSGLAVSIYMNIDQVMINHMLGAEEVGQFAAAVRISTVWYFVPVVICSSLFPAIINAKKVSEELYYARLQRLYDLMVWMAIAIALPMTFMSDWVVNLLYGQQYNQAGSVLMIHVWAGVFVSLGVASGRWLLIENMQKISFYRTAYGCLVNIVLNIFLMPRYGVQGAAIATLISQIIAAYVADLFNKKTMKMFFMKTQSLFLMGKK